MPMIETTLRVGPTRQRRITHYGKEIVFKELAGVPGRFVALVDDRTHADALVRVPGYREYTDQLQPALVPRTVIDTNRELAASPMAAQVPAIAQHASGATVRDVAVSDELRQQLAARDAENLALRQQLEAMSQSHATALAETTALSDEPGGPVDTAPVVHDAAGTAGSAGARQSPIDKAVSDPSPEQTAAAEKLLGTTAKIIRATLENNRPDDMVLGVALRIEEGSKAPRVGVVEALRLALGMTAD